MVETPVRRILLVDDEEEVRDSTRLLLESLGCEVIETGDAGDVLPMAIEHQPGLILQDLKMPGLNLAGTVAALRSEDATADIPIVFFSANPDIAETARRYDAWGFLRKPFSPQSLAEVVDQVFVPPADTEDPRRKLRAVFHEQWNVLSSIANYTHMLRLNAAEPGSMAAAEKLEGQVLRLEASIDRLHAYVSQALGGPAPEPRQAAAPGDVRPPRPERSAGRTTVQRDGRPVRRGVEPRE